MTGADVWHDPLALAAARERTGSAAGPVASFVADRAAPLRDLTVGISPVQSGSGDPSPDNVRPISGWTGANIVVSPTLEAADGTTYPVSWQAEAGTVYGGTLDVTAGTLTVKYASETLNSVYYFNKYTNYYLWFLRRPDVNPGYKLNGGALSDIFAPRLWMPGHLWTGTETAYIGVVGPDQSLTTQEEANAWMADHPAQVVFELETPITYQLTPVEIRTLLGRNNIWADTGDVALSYREGGVGSRSWMLALLAGRRDA